MSDACPRSAYAIFFTQLYKNEEGIRDNSARGVSPALCGFQGIMPEFVVNNGVRLWCRTFNNFNRANVAMARDANVIVAVWAVSRPADTNVMGNVGGDSMGSNYPGHEFLCPSDNGFT